MRIGLGFTRPEAVPLLSATTVPPGKILVHGCEGAEPMSMHSEYIARMEAQLKKWDADVDALAAEGKKAGAEARAAYDERMKDLRASRDAAQKTFLEIRQATESAGAQMQAAMQGAWGTMQEAFEKASSDIMK